MLRTSHTQATYLTDEMEYKRFNAWVAPAKYVRCLHMSPSPCLVSRDGYCPKNGVVLRLWWTYAAGSFDCRGIVEQVSEFSIYGCMCRGVYIAGDGFENEINFGEEILPVLLPCLPTYLPCPLLDKPPSKQTCKPASK